MTLLDLEYLPGQKEAYLGYAADTFVNRNHFADYLEMMLAMGM